MKTLLEELHSRTKTHSASDGEAGELRGGGACVSARRHNWVYYLLLN